MAAEWAVCQPAYCCHMQQCRAPKLQVVEATVQGAGPAGPAVFIAIYAMCAVLLFPGALMTVVAGYLFGTRAWVKARPCAVHMVTV